VGDSIKKNTINHLVIHFTPTHIYSGFYSFHSFMDSHVISYSIISKSGEGETNSGYK